MNLYQAMIEQTADAFIFSDLEGRIQLWNHGAEVIFGFSTKDAIGQSLDIIIPEHLRQAHWIGYRKAIAAGRMSLGDQIMTTRFLHKDGSKGYVDMRFSLIKDNTGKLLGVLATARDSTARYLAERTLRARLAELAPADDSKPASAAPNK
jgi:PAS domain S-box-containing protein